MNKRQHARHDRLIEQGRQDTYRARGKYRDSTTCTGCGAVFSGGRWTWKPATAEFVSTTCPACQRVAEGYPAGVVQLRGRFFSNHQEEVMNLVRNTESQESAQHPLERIMSVERVDDSVVLKTTGIHLARRIGQSLSRAYSGQFSFQYENGEPGLRVYWER